MLTPVFILPSLRCLQRVLHQRADCHRSDAAWYWCYERTLRSYLVELHVAVEAKSALACCIRNASRTYVNYHSTFLHHIGCYEVGFADCCYDDVGFATFFLDVGEPGVGKTALAYGLAARIEAGEVPERLKGSRIYELDLGSMLAGTQYRGDFEQRLKSVMKSLSAEKKVIHALESVVEEGGTGGKAAVPGYRVAGKTGTAKVATAGGYGKDYVGTFAGFAPVSNPRFAMVVIINEPHGGAYYGGSVAGPTFAEVMSSALQLYNVPPDALTDEKDQPTTAQRSEVKKNGTRS
jgi:hypothetical protein